MAEELRRRELQLKCRLTDAELEAKKGELLEWTKIRGDREHDLEGWKTDKREEQKLFEGEIMSAAATLLRTAKIIEDVAEFRMVEVVDSITGSTVTTIRTDTGETVAERAAEDHELQRRLELEAEKKEEKKAAKASKKKEAEGGEAK